jgi:2-dehydro-3-deoxyphosphogluconate aldolase/(4S)-4-hydroxy-2-oxoglutarate aldolase
MAAFDAAAIDAIFDIAPVVPVIVIDDPQNAVSLGRALVAGGLPVLEITLRTERALACLAALADLPGAIVGAGTVLDPSSAAAAVAAGARFLFSPGMSPRLLAAADAAPVPFVPGVASASEAMALADRGYERLKFFPAEQIGGARHLAALASPLPRLRFCPTGGIGADTAPAYLALSNVACVGGSWVTPADAVASGDWDRIERLARAAAALRPARRDAA